MAWFFRHSSAILSRASLPHFYPVSNSYLPLKLARSPAAPITILSICIISDKGSYIHWEQKNHLEQKKTNLNRNHQEYQQYFQFYQRPVSHFCHDEQFELRASPHQTSFLTVITRVIHAGFQLLNLSRKVEFNKLIIIVSLKNRVHFRLFSKNFIMVMDNHAETWVLRKRLNIIEILLWF